MAEVRMQRARSQPRPPARPRARAPATRGAGAATDARAAPLGSALTGARARPGPATRVLAQAAKTAKYVIGMGRKGASPQLIAAGLACGVIGAGTLFHMTRNMKVFGGTSERWSAPTLMRAA